MHILIAIFGVIMTAVVWWYRLKTASKAVGDVANHIGKIRGNLRRKNLLKKADMSPITAIASPLVAASTLLFAMQSEEFVLGEGDEAVIEEMLLNLADKDSVNEAMIYAKWAILQGTERKLVIDKLGTFLKLQLNEDEKIGFLNLLDSANQEIGGCYDYSASRDRLIRRIGLESAQ